MVSIQCVFVCLEHILKPKPKKFWFRFYLNKNWIDNVITAHNSDFYGITGTFFQTLALTTCTTSHLLGYEYAQQPIKDRYSGISGTTNM